MGYRPNLNVGIDGGRNRGDYAERERSARNITTVVYALQAASLFVGITFLIAIIVNYVKNEDVQGTWLESHFRWQIRTFWFSILWHILGAAIMMPFLPFAIMIHAVTVIWVIYRIVKGWTNLSDGKEMYA
ncbi:MAG: Uncharacterized membrane protein [Candidatus Kentron sp. G]|nr:MAG: Uncharacterized membrane protein [Candidatus Kentron sp. G]VFM95818.1 MAG: Uncharacterized membrane protein [Candidatus Kentron sp. G]VFM99733.1 MAG: Uncharacterized membrane protein [Candidatus Kentron sp. G]